MSTIREAAEAAWRGEGMGEGGRHAWRALRVLEEVAPETWFYSGFANLALHRTNDGLILIDPGAVNNAADKQAAIRDRFPLAEGPGNRVHTIVYTHGHVDHCFGAELYVEEARAQGWEAPIVVAQEAVSGRFERYKQTRGYNGIINLRQFRGGQGRPSWPGEYFGPTRTYRDSLTLDVGGVSVELKHARGETDDATWLYFPDTRVLCTGDLFAWVAPNAGNPQKAPRYCADWARALREMASRGAEVLLPGHSLPIFGVERVARALNDAASYLESIFEQTLELMNRGATLDETARRVRPPQELQDRPYLQPVYDEPEFIVRNIWRLYGGWYDGVPSHLKPASEAEQASVIAELAGGAGTVAQRALVSLEAGDLRLAGHLADWAYFADPDDAAIRDVRRRVYEARQEEAGSTMAIGLFRSAAVEMGSELEGSTLG